MFSNKFYKVLLVGQSLITAVLFINIYDNDQILDIEMKIGNLEKQFQENKNLLLALKVSTEALSNNLYETTNNNITQDSIVSNVLTSDQIESLIDDKIDIEITNKLSQLDISNSANINLIPTAISTPLSYSPQIKKQFIDNNTNYINGNYDNIDNYLFKENLFLADDIIEQAIYAGEFTDGDAQVLNDATQNLSFQNRVYIMNKLSHAYNSTKIQGKFLNFKLVHHNQ